MWPSIFASFATLSRRRVTQELSAQRGATQFAFNRVHDCFAQAGCALMVEEALRYCRPNAEPRRCVALACGRARAAWHESRGMGPVGEVVTLWLDTAQSRADWTRQLIGRLERGLYRMADDH